MIHNQSGVITTKTEKWGRLGERYQLYSLVETKIIALLRVMSSVSTEITALILEWILPFLLGSWAVAFNQQWKSKAPAQQWCALPLPFHSGISSKAKPKSPDPALWLWPYLLQGSIMAKYRLCYSNITSLKQCLYLVHTTEMKTLA